MNARFRWFTLCLLFCLLPVPAFAQMLAQTPKPGLWMIESKTLINGENILVAVRAAQQQMLKELPPEYRAAVEAALGPLDDLDRNYQCITAEEAATLSDPEAYLQRVNEGMSECRFGIVRTDGSVVQIKGRCEDAEGFSGDFEGELQIVSSTEMRSLFTGKGRYLVDVDLPGIELPDDGRVEMRMEEVSRWISTDCDAVPQK